MYVHIHKSANRIVILYTYACASLCSEKHCNVSVHRFVVFSFDALTLGESSDEESAAEVEEKPLYLKDYERQRLLERGERALVSDSEDEEADPNHSKVRCCLLCGV
jgi:hypothetical protein